MPLSGSLSRYYISECTRTIWGTRQAVKSSTAVSLYLSKYLSKRLDDPRKSGHRLFYCSQKLKRPQTIVGKDATALQQKLHKDYSDTLQYSNQYESAKNGLVKYKKYVLSES